MKTMIKGLGIAVFTVMLIFAMVTCSDPASNDVSSASINKDDGGSVPHGGFPPYADHVIDIPAIQGVTIPAKNGIPVADIIDNEQYSGTVTWSPAVSEGEGFAAATPYTATIVLTAKTGYTLQGVAADFFTVDGATSVSNAANSGVITAEFPSTDATIINIAAIHGVTVPVNGEIPVTTIEENEQYSGTVTWSPDVTGAFATITQYTATIILTPKAGYTINGLSDDFFTVEGATQVRNASGSGVVTAVFPKTAPTGVTSVSISITAPVKGEKPSTTATASDTSNFSTGTVSWLPPGTSVFLGNKEYTAMVTLTVKYGYNFAESISATINGQDAIVSNNTGSAVTLSHTFPATTEKTVSGIVVKTQPSNLTYTHGDTLDLTGLVVTLVHDDTTTEDIAAASFAEKNITANPAHGDNLVYSSTHNGQPVKITYGSLTCNSGNLIINRATPTAADFNFSETRTFIYDGSTRAVTIIPKTGKSNGTITVKYNGIPTAPSNAGTYNVTFDVTEAGDFHAANGLLAGTLTIQKATPVTADFSAHGTGTFIYDGNSRSVTVTPNTGKSDGAITVKYNGGTTAPLNTGTYTVTYDVATAANYNAASGLSAGTLTIEKATPTVADFDISGTESFYYEGNTTRAVAITPKTGKSNGALTVKYNGIPTAPSAIGTYAVTFDVAAAANFNAVNGLSAGTMTINPFTSISALDTYLKSKPNNTPTTPYIVALKVDSHGGNANFSGSLGNALLANSSKYVHIDLSSSTFSSIGVYAFANCDSLTGVIIGDSVTSIEGASFSASRITSINIPDSVTTIGSNAFQDCVYLTSITISKNATSIYGNAFTGCLSLSNITIKTNPSISQSQNWGTMFPASVLNFIFEDITSIPAYAFYNCGRLASVTIPNSVNTIGNYAFYSCSKLTDIIIPDSVTSIGTDAFRYSGLKNLTIGKGMTILTNYAFRNCASLTNIILSDSVTAIGSATFADCTSLKSVIIPNSVTHLACFSNCTGLTSINIPNSVTTLGGFDGCTSLTSVNIPNSVTTLAMSAFSGCTKLTDITIPDNISSFGVGAFNDTAWLNKQPNGLVYLGNYVYTYKGTMPANTNIILPDGIKGIAGGAFMECTNLVSVTIPGSVTIIGSQAFSRTSITSINIPNSVTTIGSNAFFQTGLTSINIPDSVTSIEMEAFSGCRSLTSVNIPNSITVLNSQVFAHCTSLTSVIIPNNITGIIQNAFLGCTGLTSVTFEGTIASNVFNSSTSFPGDLRAKFYATDATNGTPGTYTRPDGTSTTWTKQ